MADERPGQIDPASPGRLAGDSPNTRTFDRDRFYRALERRHLESLDFSEVRRAVQAISTTYVEKRGRLARGADLDGRGKRAAFALYFGALHLLLYRELFESLGPGVREVDRILDLGCGTGVGAAAWGLTAPGSPRLTGVDRNAWVLREARWLWRHLGLGGRTRRGDLERTRLPGAGAGILLGFAANELDTAGRARLLKRLLASARRGGRILVVEPIARRLTPWWSEWADAFEEASGRSFDFRRATALPEGLARMDRAAGLDHRELKARVLVLGEEPAGAPQPSDAA